MQFGFRKNCSTIQALKDLLDDKDDRIHQQRGAFYAIFIDHMKDFGLLNKCKLFTKMERLTGTNYPMNARIRHVLEYNVVKISNSVKESGYILKTNEVLQDNHFGPLLFNAATAYSEEKRK
jgi:hypothetical protein